MNDISKKMGHFRFGVINSLYADDQRTMKERFTELSDNVWTLPCGRMRQFSAATIEDWFYDCRKGGFSALCNPVRKDRGLQRCITTEIKVAIDKIREVHPRMKNSNVIILLREQGLLKEGPSDSSLYRYLRQIKKENPTAQKVRKAFEAAYPGGLYQTDIMYGPHIMVKQENGRYAKMQTYLLAIIDDYSRVICHAEFALKQDLMFYIKVLEKALKKRGIPDKIYCDNGQVFISDQIIRIGAEVGTKIVRTKVRDAAAKGKIERWFRTVRDNFIDRILATKKFNGIDELNELFFTYVEDYNNSKHSSLGCSPIQRWLKSFRQPRLLDESLHTDDLFMLETERKVKKDGTFSLQGKIYETSSTFAGCKVQIRYNSQDPHYVNVYHDGSYVGKSLLLNRQDNDGTPRLGDQ